MTIKAVCVHVHVSDNRKTMRGAEHSWLPVDVDNKETLCDDNKDTAISSAFASKSI